VNSTNENTNNTEPSPMLNKSKSTIIELKPKKINRKEKGE
jgi:hypothetical protein